MTEGASLEELARLCRASLPGAGAVRVRGVQSDSRRVAPGDLFAAVPGATHDGARFVDDALARGASAVLAERELSLPVPLLRCERVRDALGPVAHHVYGQPSRGWPVVAVTGTNGKTTVSHLVEHVLQRELGPVALCGTIGMRGPAPADATGLTTPEADVLARYARAQRDAGARALVMEASSIAISQGRLGGMQLEVVAYTNLSQDHLDFHGTMDAYGEAKAQLFVHGAPRHCVVCVDDDFGRQLAQRAAGPVIRCGSTPEAEADVRVVHWQSSRAGLAAELATPAGPVQVRSPLIGAHNLQNLCVTLGIAQALELDLTRAAQALSDAAGAPGRLERVADPRGTAIFVDYAHTPDAVARALAGLRPITEGQLWILIGCGGDRDRKKRAPMGRAAVEGADCAVLTSDNPRSEPPEVILAEVREGALAAGGAECQGIGDLASRGAPAFACEVDRATAIRQVIAAAGPADTVLIAGKGHEDYQIVGQEKRPFDDREVAREAVMAREQS